MCGTLMACKSMPEIGILFWTLYGKTEKTWTDLLTFLDLEKD